MVFFQRRMRAYKPRSSHFQFQSLLVVHFMFSRLAHPVGTHLDDTILNPELSHRIAMSSSAPTRKELQQLVRRKIHGIPAGAKATLDATLQQEIKARKKIQDELDGVRRQNCALGDLVSDYEEILPQLEGENRVYEEEIQEFRRQSRRTEQQAHVTDEYTRLLEQHCEELENASTRALVGASRREKDLRMELNTENMWALKLEQSLHLQEEENRKIVQWQIQHLRAERGFNQALSRYTAEIEQHLLRLKESQEQSQRKVNNLQRVSAMLAHQGQYRLACRSLARKAMIRKRRRSSIDTDSVSSMVDCIESTDFVDVDDIAMPDLPQPSTERLKPHEVMGVFHKRFYPREGLMMATWKPDRDLPMAESDFPQVNSVWLQHRERSADLWTDSSDSESSYIAQMPPRKKRTRELNRVEEINESPKRRRFSAEAPELRPKLQGLVIDETKVTTPSQTEKIRMIRPRFSAWAAFKGAIGRKRQKAANLTPIRRSELPPAGTNLLGAASDRQRFDTRGLSLSLNDLPQLPSGQMPGMWPSDAPGDVDLASCQQAWRELLNWLLQLLWRQPRALILSVGLVVMAWVWHCHRAHDDWMTANEVPYSVAAELRNARVKEIRWLESLVYSVAERLDMDRSMLG